MGEIFNTFLIFPLINALVFVYKILGFLNVPFTLGISIILLTVLIRFLIYPLTNAQLKSAQKMQALKPHLDKIKEKHKNDKARQQQETMQLYKQHGINPAAGCLPLLIQMPLFIALYNVFLKIVNVDTMGGMEEINKALYSKSLYLEKTWDSRFFGISLAATPSNAWQAAPVLLAVPVVTAILQFIQSKMMSPKVSSTPSDKNKGDDFQKAMQTQMVYFLPLMIGFFSFSFPIGLSLYWNTFTVFGIIQQYRINKKKNDGPENN